MSRSWNELAREPRPSWYLDPEVAAQKRAVHQELIRRWIGGHPLGRIFKTDLFEDAWGRDAILSDLFGTGSTVLFGTDIAFGTVEAARARTLAQPLHGFAGDVRRLPIRPSSFDTVVSTSTLDHFANSGEFQSALFQICDAIKPGGALFITLDNPLNPLYWGLRAMSVLHLSPFYLGYTPQPRRLVQALEARGFEVSETRWLIHNPRLISTALINMLRMALGDRAGGPIRMLLRTFAVRERLASILRLFLCGSCDEKQHLFRGGRTRS